MRRVTALLAVGVLVGVALTRLRPFRVAVVGDSMSPTLLPGDYLVAVRSRALRRGDVVVVRARGMEMVKRVVGLPGERVTLELGSVRVDERLLEEPYARGVGPGGAWTAGPDDCVVLGDNRERSTDARAFGLLDRRDVVGVVLLRYWPRVGRVR